MACARLGNEEAVFRIGNDKYIVDSKKACNKDFVKQRNIFLGRFISELSKKEGSSIERIMKGTVTIWRSKN